jgi:metallophosphoesterase superfamily enzyme
MMGARSATSGHSSSITRESSDGNSNYSISGHIHPGIRIGGIAKQALSFPCFYFGKRYAVLPAFSRFTGFALIQPRQDENVFAIVENKLLQIQ